MPSGVLLFMYIPISCTAFPEQKGDLMEKISLNLGWAFRDRNVFFLDPASFDPAGQVDLPHDFIVSMPRSPEAAGGSANGFFGDGQGIYEKTLDVPEEWTDRRVVLDIDGAYMNTEVTLNREVIGLHPYGYTPYLVDLTGRLKPGANQLKISVQSRQPSSRWYSGGGLYRGVSLWVGEKTGILPWDLFVTTLEADKDQALVYAEAAVSTICTAPQPVTIHARILDSDGSVAAEGSIQSTVVSGTKTKSGLRMKVLNPRLWSPDAPNLYTLSVTVSAPGQKDETAQTVLGIRRYEVDAEHGLSLNGRPLKLKGGCIHHDHGFLGSAAWPRAEERKIQILKAAGYNAVRISHYPPSLAMLEVCDREGIILLDEAFDCWRTGKVPMDYHLYFEDWWERDVEAMVMRDRNHPCVFSYSIGNEISERDGSADGYAWAHRIADKIRSLDSTHYVTSALNGVFDMEAFEAAVKEAGGLQNVNFQNLDQTRKSKDTWGIKTQDFASALDIVGYNYQYQRYAEDRTKFPGRVIMGTETHPFNTYDYWKATMDNPHVIGDFIWTAYDNLGEAGVGRVVWNSTNESHGFLGDYPWRSCFQGDMDLCGYRTAQSFYREIMWEAFDGGSDRIAMFTTHPCHYGDDFWGTGWHWRDVQDCWNFEDEWLGKPVPVFVYADADEVEFFCNGRLLGRSPVEKLTASMDIPYEPGTLEAVAFRGGEKVASVQLCTTGKPAALAASADRPVICADRQDLSFIALSIVDENGRRVPCDTRTLHIEVSGAGHLAGIGSGNPCTTESYGVPFCQAYEGRAMAAVIADSEGDIQVRVWADDVEPAEVTVRAVSKP